jgi:hypothetical protein
MDEICLDWHTIFSAHFLTEENGRTNVTWHIQVTSLKRFNKIRVAIFQSLFMEKRRTDKTSTSKINNWQLSQHNRNNKTFIADIFSTPKKIIHSICVISVFVG